MIKENAIHRLLLLRHRKGNTELLNESLDMAIEALRQPERVYCLDCKYYDTEECMGRNAFYGLKDDDYCSWAERKEE